MLKHFLNPPNWFTSAGFFCGFYAILLAAGNPGDPGVFYQAGLLIFFAMVFDLLDGGVARATGRGSDFGIQLDSLSDAVGFCIAPAVLVYAWGLDAMGWFGLAVSFAFALCGIFRLARFNVAADGTKETHSEGLTTTMAGGMLAAMVMSHAALGRTFVAHVEGPLALTALLALLMVSPVPFRTFKSFRLNAKTKALFALTAGTGIALGLVYDISLWLFGLAVLYLVSGPVEALLGRRAARRAAGHGIHVELDDDDE
jgi:CDP-diacylglycerol---serine O-phosphatidyltransferase